MPTQRKMGDARSKQKEGICGSSAEMEKEKGNGGGCGCCCHCYYFTVSSEAAFKSERNLVR